jgi:prolyl 4-hydroxylase
MNRILLYLVLVLFFLIIIIYYCYFSLDTPQKFNISQDLDNLKDYKIKKYLFDDYEIWEVQDLLTKEECNKLITYTTNLGLHTSEVLNYDVNSNQKTKVDTDYRKCKQAWVPDSNNEVVQKLAKISQDLTNIPISHQEQTQVAYYEAGGQFKEHYDACVYEDKEYCNNINNGAGERRSTLLLYLNDDYVGGETEFVDLGLKIKPETGKAILFWSTDNDEKLLLKSKHKANPIISGNKWIATKWSHPKPFY